MLSAGRFSCSAARRHCAQRAIGWSCAGGIRARQAQSAPPAQPSCSRRVATLPASPAIDADECLVECLIGRVIEAQSVPHCDAACVAGVPHCRRQGGSLAGGPPPDASKDPPPKT